MENIYEKKVIIVFQMVKYVLKATVFKFDKVIIVFKMLYYYYYYYSFHNFET